MDELKVYSFVKKKFPDFYKKNANLKTRDQKRGFFAECIALYILVKKFGFKISSFEPCGYDRHKLDFSVFFKGKECFVEVKSVNAESVVIRREKDKEVGEDEEEDKQFFNKVKNDNKFKYKKLSGCFDPFEDVIKTYIEKSSKQFKEDNYNLLVIVDVNGSFQKYACWSAMYRKKELKELNKENIINALLYISRGFIIGKSEIQYETTSIIFSKKDFFEEFFKGKKIDYEFLL